MAPFAVSSSNVHVSRSADRLKNPTAIPTDLTPQLAASPSDHEQGNT